MPDGQFKNLVSEVTTTVGAGDLTLVARAGYARFSQRFAVGAQVYYKLESGNDWEVGIGLVGPGNTFIRAAPLETLVAGVLTTVAPGAINLPAGNKYFSAVIPGQFLDAVVAGSDLNQYKLFGGL